MTRDDPRRVPLAQEVAALLAEADAEIAAHRPVCRASGRCCRFEEYGHRLYVTQAEVVHFAVMRPRAQDAQQQKAGEGRVSLPQFFAGEAKGCPYQIDGLCTAREARPLGCRVYFCDPAAQDWQQDLYEKYHARLKALHEKYGLDYAYLEWRSALRPLAGLSPQD